jgi:hypothetical protein
LLSKVLSVIVAVPLKLSKPPPSYVAELLSKVLSVIVAAL